MKYAVIDIGSNSIKMSVAQIDKKKVVIEKVSKIPLRLLPSEASQIEEEKIEQLILALIEFQRVIKKFDCSYRCFATSSLRRASNQKEVLDRVRNKIGIEIEIISGDEESRLVLMAHQALFDLSKGHFLIFDIGGGSIECIELLDSKVLFQKSIEVGVLRVKQMFENNEYNKESVSRVFFGIQEIFKKVSIPKSKKNTKALMSGGNPSAVAKMTLKFHQIHFKEMHGQDVYFGEMNKLLLSIIHKEPSKITKTFDVKPHRADLAVPAVVLLGAILDYVDVDYYTLSKTGIRYGEMIRKMESL